MTTVRMSDDLWIEILTVELRLRRVPGAVIGDVVASVREFTADSGQSAEEAFGAPRAYADSLELPQGSRRELAIRTVVQPVLGLFAFVAFALGCREFFDGSDIMLSAPQVILLSLLPLATLAFGWPIAMRSLARLRWMPAVLIGAGAVIGVVSALLAPASRSDAWLILPPVLILLGAGALLVLLSVWMTALNLRHRKDDQVIDPLRGPVTSPLQRAFPSLAGWIFPILAIVVLGMLWVQHLIAA